MIDALVYVYVFLCVLAWHLGTDWFNAVAEGKLLCMFRKYHEHVVPRDFLWISLIAGGFIK